MQTASILIIDKDGNFGPYLLEQLTKEYQKIIYVSGKRLNKFQENVIFLPYLKKLPIIPQDDYARIIVFYQDEEIEHFLPQFLNEANKSRGKLYLILPFEKADGKFSLETSSNFHKIILGQMFGKPFLNETINQILVDAKIKGEMKIGDLGMAQIFPVFFDDEVSALVELIKKDKLPKIVFLFSKHPFTELSFARYIQKTDPDIKSDFFEEKRKYQDPAFPDGDYFFSEYPLHEKIKKGFESLSSSKTEDFNDLKKEPSRKEKKEKRKDNNFLLILTSLILAFVMPLIIFTTATAIGAFQLKGAKDNFEKGNFVGAQKSASLSKDFLMISLKSEKIIMFEGSLLGREKDAKLMFKNISSGYEVANLVLNLTKAAENIVKVSSGESKSPKEDFISSSNLLRESLYSYQRIKAENESTFLKDIVVDEKIDRGIYLLSSLSEVLPNLLGFEGEKKYLVLFQNNMELRPGGGFIGSFGILSLKDGKIIEFPIYDVYDADGQLKGHIEPPFPIRRYIPLVHWYLRDSNFDVDFTKSAANAVFFLNQEMGISVDGVVAADITFIKNLLSEVGPLNVSDYNETVTADNLYLVTQAHVEKNFFKGSTQKKDFLRSLYSSLLNKLSSKNYSYLKLAQAIVSSISQKHLLFVSGNTNIQKAFTVNGLSSSLWDNREEGIGKINDFLGVNEANIGSDKANYFIKRKIDQKVTIDEKGEISEVTTVYFKNDSNGWPGGDYKNYIRFILPLSAKLASVSIDDSQEPITKAVTDFMVYEGKNFKPPKELEVEEKEEEGKKTYGFLVIIPQNSLKKVTISYTLSKKDFSSSGVLNYNLKIFKQPGTEDDQYSFSLRYPNNLNPFYFSKELSQTQNQISNNFKFLEDKDYQITFSRK